MPKDEEKKPEEGGVYVNGVCLRKVKPLRPHRGETGKRRQTIAVTDYVAGAVANHETSRCGTRAVVHRELSMKLPAIQQEITESELSLAFSKFHVHRRAASHAADASVKQTHHETAVQQSVEKQPPPKTARSKLPVAVTSKPSDAGYFPREAGYSQSVPTSRSTSSLASYHHFVQKPSGQNLGAVSKPKEEGSLTLASTLCDGDSATSTQQYCAANPSIAESNHSTETERCCPGSAELKIGGQDVAKAVHNTGTVNGKTVEKSTASKDTASVIQVGESAASSLIVASKVSLNSERPVTHSTAENSTNCPVSQMQECSTAELKPSSTDSLDQNAARSVVSRTTSTQPQAHGPNRFARQKSCPANTDASGSQHVLNKAQEATGDKGQSVEIPRAVEGLRSRASWRSDESGNKLEIALKKSHSLALKPRKSLESSAANGKIVAFSAREGTDGRQIVNAAHGVTASEIPSRKSTDEPASCQDGESETRVGRGRLEHFASLDAGKTCAVKKCQSATVTCIRDLPEEPMWLAVARQKMQRWTEGQV